MPNGRLSQNSAEFDGREARSREAALTFTGMNYVGVVVATILGFGVGALWYMLFGKPWMAALGKTEAEIRANNAPTPYIPAVVGNFILAIILAAVLQSLGAPLTVAGAVAIGFLL